MEYFSEGKKVALFVLGGLFAIAMMAALKADADTGFEAATRREVGSYVESRTVSVSSSAATALLTWNVKRPDSTCFNNSAYTVWLGSAATGTTLSNIGFPVLSSATFRLESMTGSVYGLADNAAGGSIDVRCFDGLVR